MGNQLTPEQLEALLTYAGQRLGTTPEALKETMAREGLYGLSRKAADAGLSPEAAAQAEAWIRDPEKAEALMNNPAVRRLLGQLFDPS